MPVSDEEVIAEDEFYCPRQKRNVTSSDCGECEDEGLDECGLGEDD